MVHPYWKYPNQNFDSHIYPRGAAVLHMLRQIIGDENFKKFQKEFLTNFRFGNPTTNDLIRAVNDVTSSDINWFFDQWVLSAGHPQVQVSSRWDDGELTIFINQTQQGRNTPFIYEMPTEVAFYYKNRIEKKSIFIDDRKNLYKFKLKYKPTFVRLDPNNDLLIEVDQELSRDALLIQLKRDNVIGRMEAANNLSDHLQDSQVLKQLKRTAYYDKSWFVRQACLKVISSEVTFKEWTVAYDREKNSQPRKAIITEMATNYPREAAAFIRNKISNDNSYIVQAEMVKQLGIAGNKFDVKLIKKYAQEWSPRHIIDRAAKRAISSLQGE